ncbi:MAG: GHKL domain-containing protein, partial [Lachnospiraceae bacterium]|nr:GHKL domain-containing protein [Lachnospiraceae bacterium]
DMQYIYYFLLYAVEAIKFYIIYKDYFGFLERKKGKIQWIVLIAGIAIMALSMKNCSIKVSPLFIYVSFILLEGACLFKVSLLYLLIYSFLAMEIVSILDTMSTVLVETIIELCGKSELSFEKIFVYGITLSFMYGVNKLLKRKNKNYPNKIPFVYIVLFMIIGIGNSIMLELFQEVIESYEKTVYKVIFLLVAMGMFLDMAMIFILVELNQVYKEKNELNREYLASQNEHYAYLEKREYETKKFRHDIRNHILVLADLCKRKEIEKAEQYIEEMWGRINKITISISVNHGIVDAILNQYASVCAEENIMLKIKGHMPVQCKIEAFDLCTIFSNLLSNAIEAGRESAEKEIKLEIRYDLDTIYIYMENYYAGKRKVKNGIAVTQKRDKNRHGYGVINIIECVQKYNGIFECWLEKNKFITMITINNYFE